MGQKVNPNGLRIGVIKDWDSKWYADANQFGDFLVEDQKIRKYIKETLYKAGIAKIAIERGNGRIKITILAAQPGMIIGAKGEGIEKIKAGLKAYTDNKISLNILEVKRAEKDAQLVAEKIAKDLEDRQSFRRAMKRAMSSALKAGAKGVKTKVSGRVGGAEIARSESYIEGNLPLATLRCDIDYGFAEANTAYGKLGVKVWINQGEVLPVKENK